MRKTAILTLAALIGSTAFAAGEIYRWRDANGTWHYSDQFKEGAEIVSRRPAPAAATTAPAGIPMPTPAPVAPPAATADALPVTKEQRDQFNEQRAASKADQCKQAEEFYQKAMRAPRIYTTDEKGVRTYMDAAKADESRLQALAARDLACK